MTVELDADCSSCELTFHQRLFVSLLLLQTTNQSRVCCVEPHFIFTRNTVFIGFSVAHVCHIND